MLEYLEGKVSQKVSPKLRHSTLQAEIVERINRLPGNKTIARAFP